MRISEDRFELCRIWNMGAQKHWCQSKVADRLGISVRALRDKVYNLKKRYPDLSFPPLEREPADRLSKDQIRALNAMLNKNIRK